MKRYFRACSTIIALLISNGAWLRAEDKFITQPSVRAAAVKPAEPNSKSEAAKPQSNLVLQPSLNTPAPTSQKQDSLAQTKIDPAQEGRAVVSSAAPASQAPNSGTAKSDTFSSRNANSGMPAGNGVAGYADAAVGPGESLQDHDGLTWVRRGTLAGRTVAATTSELNPNALQYRTVEVAVPATAKRSQSGVAVDTIASAPTSAMGWNTRNETPNGINSVANQSTGPARMGNQLSQQAGLHGPANLNRSAVATEAATVESIVVEATEEHAEPSARPRTSIPVQFANQEAADKQAKMRLASKVSNRIVGSEPDKKTLVTSGGAMLGPAAMGQQLSELLITSERLCQRGLFKSARQEADAAALRLARYVDSVSNRLVSEPSLKVARNALREVIVFHDGNSAGTIQDLINAHDTPILKNVDVQQIPPATLSKAYYQYAEEKLIEASLGHPWFSDVYYTLGRTFQAEADSEAAGNRDHLRTLAVVYYRAAAAVRPTNSLATNQLGYVLLQMDRPAEAHAALVSSIQVKTDTPALQNLAEASRRLGDINTQQWALQMIARIGQRPSGADQPQLPQVIEVDHGTFRSTTPMIQSNRTGSGGLTAAAPFPSTSMVR